VTLTTFGAGREDENPPARKLPGRPNPMAQSRRGREREIAAPSLAKGSVAAAPIDWVEGNDLPPADRAGEVEREGRGAAAVRRIGLWFAARPEGVGRVY
jgi:hypothetical protein